MTTLHYKFAVAEADFVDGKQQFQATFDDFDLDCQTGWGDSPEAAIIELLQLNDLPRFNR